MLYITCFMPRFILFFRIKFAKRQNSKYTYMALVPSYVGAGTNATIQVLFAKPVTNERLTVKLFELTWKGNRNYTRKLRVLVTHYVPRSKLLI
jgi:hypothetical protein